MTTMEQSIPPAAIDVAGASFAARLLALLIDLVVVALLNGAFMALLGGTLANAIGEGLWPLLVLSGSLLGAGLLLPPLFGLAYFTIFHACGGQTIGKLLLGLRVVGIDGEELSWGRSFLRAVGQFGSLLPLAAGFLWALVDRDRRAWHDYLAGSRVVAVEKSLDKEPAFQ